MTTDAIRLIDLFSGAGGLTCGFVGLSGCPFESVWANDFDADCVDSYNANFGPHCFPGDIHQYLRPGRSVIPPADVVIGGPPCQGFSLLNRQRDGDVRRELWRPFLEVVELSGASVFVMENVPQLLQSPEGDMVRAAAESMGFMTAAAKLCAADYGVPQVRYRAFIVGVRGGSPSEHFPAPRTHCEPERLKTEKTDRLLWPVYVHAPQPWATVRQAIADLPPEPCGTELNGRTPPLDLHFGRNPTEMSRQRYRAIPEEGMNRFDLQRRAPDLTPGCWIRKRSGGTDLFGRLWWDRPAFTIRTEFFKPEKGRYLHPSEHRPITHREAARLQTFPDAFKFVGSKISIAKQIGNAVPPLLAAHVARSVCAIVEASRIGCTDDG